MTSICIGGYKVCMWFTMVAEQHELLLVIEKCLKIPPNEKYSWLNDAKHSYNQLCNCIANLLRDIVYVSVSADC